MAADVATTKPTITGTLIVVAKITTTVIVTIMLITGTVITIATTDGMPMWQRSSRVQLPHEKRPIQGSFLVNNMISAIAKKL